MKTTYQRPWWHITKRTNLVLGCVVVAACSEVPTAPGQHTPGDDAAIEHAVEVNQQQDTPPGHPVVLDRQSAPAPKQPVHKTKKVTATGWTYNAERCASAFLKTLYSLEYDDPDAQLFLGDNGDFPVATADEISTSETTLFSYQRAVQMPPKTLLGNIILETGDGCRSYRSALVYRIQRAKYPKFKRHFIHYTKRPGWVMDYFYDASTAKASFDAAEINMTALYRKDFIVYEVDYNATPNKIKNRFRHVIRSCFKPLSGEMGRGRK